MGLFENLKQWVKNGINFAMVTATSGPEAGGHYLANEYGMINTDQAIGIAFVVIIVSVVIPIAFSNFYSADVTSFCKTDPSTGVKTHDTGVVSLWYLLPLAVIIAIVAGFFYTHHKR